MGDYSSGDGICFDNSTRFSDDGSFADCASIASMSKAFEINAELHGKCVEKHDFIEARKYSSRLFFIKEQALAAGVAEELARPLLEKGESVAVWAAGLAAGCEETAEAAIKKLLEIARGGGPFADSAKVILSEYGGQM